MDLKKWERLRRMVRGCLLGAALLGASGPAVASVMVPGSDGQSLPLNQIDDIMRHVTGETGENLILRKQSLILVENTLAGGQFTITPTLYTFDADGVRMLSGDQATSAGDDPVWDLAPGLHPVTLSSLPGGGRKVTLIDPGTAAAPCDISIQRDVGSGLTLSLTGAGSGTFGGTSYTLSRKAGVTVNGFDGELIAELGWSGDDQFVNFHAVTTSNDLSIAKVQTFNFKPAGELPRMEGTDYCPPASAIAVGDFDDDGYANEAALIYSDMATIALKVLQLTHAGTASADAQFNVAEIYSSTLHTYQNSNKVVERLRSMDGLARTLSVAVAAGDFDGDRKTEFVTAFRDNSGDGNLNGKNEISFTGISGKVHVVVHKWDGSTFQTGEIVKGYDHWNPDSSNYQYRAGTPLSLKAVAADTNGDGRDEIVVMRLQYEDTYSYYEGHNRHAYAPLILLDVYECNANAITPNEPWTIDTRATYRDDLLYFNLIGRNDFYGSTGNTNFLQVFTGNTQSYGVWDREFAIAAGKFAGRMGAATICDDLIVLYPERRGNVNEKTNENLLSGKVKLLTNIQKDQTVEATEFMTLPERGHLAGFIVEDYAGESVVLGAVKKVVSDIQERNYLALLQAPPFHVDNLAADGSALEAQPRNFTYRNGSEVSYQNSAQTTSKDVVAFQMRGSVETVFAFDSPELRSNIGTYNSLKGVAASVLGNPNVQTTLPGAPAIEKTFGGVTGLMDKLTDHVKTTTDTTNTSASTAAIDLTTTSTKSDVAYYSKSDQYIWRYPVLTQPAPAWLMGDRIDRRGDFAGAGVEDQQCFIAFVICDTPASTTAYALDDSLYQPFHEPGNLFSYPAALEQIEGYADRTELTNPLEWNGPKVEKTLSLSEATGEHTVKSTKVETGLFSKALSFVDSVFKTDLANVPEAGDPTDFTRTTSSTESITVKIPELNSGAGHKLMMDGYLDVTGAMAMSFAVTSLNRDDALWGTNSLYSKKADPALVLPYKFPFSQHPDDKGNVTVGFTGNDNDPTALKMKGLRFSAPAYGMGSSGLLLKGMQYQIAVPVYNASFVEAKGVTVRLSYAQSNEYNAPRTTIQDLTLDLPGWGGGNRAWANFEWTPDLADGTWYLFVELDPDNAIDEVHENRRDASGNIVDYGGNNLGCFKIGVASTESPVYDRDAATASASKDSVSGSAVVDSYGEGAVTVATTPVIAIPRIQVTFNGASTLKEFWASDMDGATAPVPVEIEVSLDEVLDRYVHRVIISGFGYRAGTREKVEAGGKIGQEDRGVCFLQRTETFFPHEPNTFTFLMDPDPSYDPVTGEGFGFEIEFASVKSGNAEGGVVSSGGGSGGCDVAGAGAAGLLLMALLGLRTSMKKFLAVLLCAAALTTVTAAVAEDGAKYRLERDSVGEKQVPADAYYGVQTLRAAENFRITGLPAHPEMINSLVQIKKAADIAKEALKTGKSIRELLLEDEVLTEDELNRILDPVQMTEPGIAGKELLERK